MGKTFAEKILALKSGKKSVVTGEIVTVSSDIVMSHDNTAAIAKKFKQIGIDKVKHPIVSRRQQRNMLPITKR